ncbi:3-hydroxybutyryl-CoA dehydrogenase [Balamuthia mandrillaris]
MWRAGAKKSFVDLAAGTAVRRVPLGQSSLLSASASAQTRLYAANPVRKVGVIGAGQMGAGIAQVAAQTAKLDVVLMDANEASIQKSMKLMDKLFEKNVAKGKMTAEEVQDTKKRISVTTDFKAFDSVDFVVEAVTEDVAVKEKIFKEVEKATAPTAILATNTSSISITKIAAFTQRPDKVIGMHFMNPVPVMKLVEIIPGLATSSETLDTTLKLAEAMGKTTARSDDRPGFIANRLLMPYINEAVMALQDGLGSREDIDVTMKLGCNMPMGPLQLADFIGLDTCLAIMRVLHSQLGDDKYRPCPLLIKYVDAGWLGVKSGRGFYEHNKQ